MHSHAERGNDQFSSAPIDAFPAEAGPTECARCPVGLALAVKLLLLPSLLIFIHCQPIHRETRLWCRPNADDAQWAKPHGCGESAVRTGMSVRRGPTERRRSEGIPTKEEPNQELRHLVTWCLFK